MAAKMDASRIRELLLDFYQTNDPERLAMGLDIFSMVIWTQKHGIESLNELLEDQYGVGIDPDKNLGGSKQDFKRFSTLVAGGGNPLEAAKRLHIREKVQSFYEDHDPSKLNRLDDFVQYIMLHGADAFNRKLYNKYGESIDLDDVDVPAQSTKSVRKPPPAPPKKAPPPPPPKRRSSGSSRRRSRRSDLSGQQDHDNHDSDMNSFGEAIEEEPHEDDIDLPPPPPPTASMVRSEGIDETRAKLREKLEAFYLDHDPAKLTHLDAIVDWGMGIGEIQLEEKLIQLYGSGFDSPPGRKGSSVSDTVRRSLQSVASAASRLRKPKPPKPPVFHRQKPTPPQKPTPSQKPTPPQMPTPPQKPVIQTRQKPTPPQPPVFHKQADPNPTPMVNSPGLWGTSPPTSPVSKPPAPRKKPTPPKAPWGAVDPSSRPTPAVRAEEDLRQDTPCNFYELDLTGASFGMCKCGFSRLAHVKGSPEYRKATEDRQFRAQVQEDSVRGRASVFGDVVEHPATPTRTNTPLGTEPTRFVGSFLSKTTKDATQEQPRADVRAHGGEKGGDGPCDNFKLDMYGQSYGVCECGFPRDQHKMSYAPPAESKSRVLGSFVNRFSRRGTR